MKILVTGLSGFTGRHLISLLNHEGWIVVPLVRRHCGYQNEIIWDFSSDLPGDLPACDAVVHLAADVHFGQDLHCGQYRANTVATAKLVAYSRVHQAFFIFASSIAVHGQTEQINQESAIKTENHYALSKYLAEEIIQSFSTHYAILRITGIYGLDGPTHLGLNRSISLAYHNGEAPKLAGGGTGKRNYICVIDVARWIVCLIKENCSSPRDLQTILYLADCYVLSIKDYLEAIVNCLIPGGQIARTEGPAGRDLVVDPSPAPFKLTGFTEYLDTLKEKGPVGIFLK